MKAWTITLGLLVACLSGWVAGSRGEEPDRIIVLSVGQGDCAVVQSEGRTVLIDVGPRASQDNLYAHLLRYGIDHVDTVLLSHPDMDHVGGLDEIHRDFPGAAVVAPSGFLSDPKLTETLEADGVRTVRWVGAADGDLGRFKIQIRCPQYDGAAQHGSDNSGSMFVRVSEGEASYVTSGDAPSQTEEAMVPEGIWHAEVLHVGHHGSRSASSAAWLQAVHPRLAIVSCGKGNRYGHPHREVVQRIQQDAIELKRTDLNGDLELDVVNGHLRLRS